ncbi:MAG: HlyD family efflux transporter periplasmic adaptor subunit [Planctomycetes bacterium]|nr:HlyD family efflux transporter periplasmic adaptor subunit [Planctomycetota bacterium]
MHRALGHTNMTPIQDTSAQDRVVERHGPRRRGVVLLSALALVAVAAFLLFPRFQTWASADQSFERARLRFATVERGTLVRDLSVEGRIVASSYPTLYSPARGTVALAVRAGETVAKGQPLATIHSPDLESQVQQEASALAAADAELSSLRATNATTKLRNEQDAELKKLRLETAQREFERSQRSLDEGLISQRELDRAHDDVAIAELERAQALKVVEMETVSLDHQIKNRENQVERQRLVHAEAERRVRELEIASPVAGVVGKISVDPRDIVLQNQELMTVIDLSAYEIEISIPETFADEIALGIPAEILHEGQTYVGRVSSVSPEVTGSLVQGRVVFGGEQPASLKQNQRVSTRIILSARENVLKLRRGPFLESGGGRSCYVVDGDLAVEREIRAGARSLTEVEIETGLELGETVVISDTSRFDGAHTVLLRQ